MAIIAPNTDIYLLQGVPLNDYENTFFFATSADQYTYFYSKRAQTLTNYTFQRNNGRLRCSVPAETAMQYNYMMYRNTSFGNKWFYAFIRNVYYINNETSEIEFEIDAMQTWFFEYTHFSNLGSCTIDECFIQRQHAPNDSLGSNVIPEPVEVGEYVYNGNFTIIDPHFATTPSTSYEQKMQKFTEYIVVASFVDNDSNRAYVNCLTYGLSGLKTAFFYPFSAGLRNLLTAASAAGQPDAVKALSYVPRTTAFPYIKDAMGSGYSDADIELILRTLGVFLDTDLDISGQSFFMPNIHSVTVTIPHLTGTETLDGYLPFNKKLYTYPYNSLVLSDGTGENKIYQYELFSNMASDITFKWYGNIVPPIETYLMPDNYKNISANNTVDKFIITKYAQGSWSNDAYQAWLAQNSMGLTTGLINAELGALTGGFGGMVNGELLNRVLDAQRDDFIFRGEMGFKSSYVPIRNSERNIGMNTFNSEAGAATSSISGIFNALSTMHQAKAQTDIIGGNTNSNGLQDLGFKSLCYNRLSLRYQYAQRVDQFFNLYGYAQNIVGKAMLNARSRYTYVKTIGCDIHGNIPVSYADIINKNFDTGVRFWKDTTNFQDYSIANNPLSS